MKFTQEQINVTVALSIMRLLYEQGKLPEKSYKNIEEEYRKKAIVIKED